MESPGKFADMRAGAHVHTRRGLHYLYARVRHYAGGKLAVISLLALPLVNLRPRTRERKYVRGDSCSLLRM